MNFDFEISKVDFSMISVCHCHHVHKDSNVLCLKNDAEFKFCLTWLLKHIQSTLVISKSKGPSEHFEISVLRHIRGAELRKIPVEQPNFTNEHAI